MAAAYSQDCFLLFGDSITQGSFEPGMNGIGQRLAHVYARKLDVLNRGLAGYNTEWAIPVFEQCLAQQHEMKHVPKIKILTIWFGANDACLEQSPQHVPLDKFTANLKRMIQMIQSPTSPYFSSTTKIILLTPPPVDTAVREADLASRDPPLKLDRDFDVTRSYAEAVKKVGAAHSVPIADVWSGVWTAANEKEGELKRYLSDGLHLSEAGYEIAYKELNDCILNHYPDLHHEKLEYVFQGWAMLDWKAAAKSLENRAARFQQG